MGPATENTFHDLILFDGVCGLCNGFNQFVLRRDGHGAFLFASLQSALGRGILQRHGRDPDALEALCVLPGYGAPLQDRLLTGPEAVYHVLVRLGQPWKAISTAGGLLPRSLSGLGYRFVAARRYRLFGKHDSCPIPSPQTRKRFLEI